MESCPSFNAVSVSWCARYVGVRDLNKILIDLIRSRSRSESESEEAGLSLVTGKW